MSDANYKFLTHLNLQSKFGRVEVISPPAPTRLRVARGQGLRQAGKLVITH